MMMMETEIGWSQRQSETVQIKMDNGSWFQGLPLPILEQILDNLELSSAWRLGGTCKYLHKVILEDDEYWRRRARRSMCIQLVNQEEQSEHSEKVKANLGLSPGATGRDRALVHDPSLNGHKELLKIYILKPTFRAAAAHKAGGGGGDIGLGRRPLQLNSTGNRPVAGGLFGLLQSLSLWEEFVSRDIMDTSQVSHTKLALFGPGIESSRTKHLVHRIVQAHDSSLNAVDFVAGLPGGIGSGVRVKFEKGRVFDLVCLYTNSGRLREDHRGVARLLARHNHMLVQDADDVGTPLESGVGGLDGSEQPGQPGTSGVRSGRKPQQWLHENVMRVLPTLDVLLFAIDVTAVPTIDMIYVKRELDIMLQACPSHDIPVVILCCFNTSDKQGKSYSRPAYDMVGLTNALDMGRLSPRPWSVFEVDARDMRGFVNALRWIFYRQEKQRNQLKYHSSMANCTSPEELLERLRSLW